MSARLRSPRIVSQEGYLVLVLLIPLLMIVIAVGVFGWVWYSRSQGNVSELNVAESVVVTPSPIASVEQVCAQVVTSVVDPVSGQCRQFPTPCDVPSGWKMVMSCSSEELGWQKYSPGSGIFSMNYPTSWDFFVRQTSIEVLGFTNLITQVAFDDKETGKRNPFGEILGRVELSWLGSASYETKTIDDFIASYYRNGNPVETEMRVGELMVVRVEHKNCSANKGCVDYVFKSDKVFYVLRALSVGDKSEDETIMLTMLNSWRFLSR